MAAQKRPASACAAKANEAENVCEVKRPRQSDIASNSELMSTLSRVRAGLAGEKGYAAQLGALTETAKTLMNQWDLWIAGQRHRIAELEAYVHSASHVDPYTHGDEGQGSCGVWYFHRKGGSYKSGSFKGMDLACGDEESGVHAGLLLRSVVDCTTNQVTEGPCLVVDRILKLSGHASIASFAAGRVASELSALTTENLMLREAESSRVDRVWTAARVGLVLREDAADESGKSRTHSSGRPSEYCTRPYRFSTIPDRLSKFRSGFAAVAHLDGERDSIGSLGIPQQHLEKYIAAVDRGVKSADPTKWVNCKINTQPDFCDMIGSCHTVLKYLP